jgi:hypothetical protein
LVSNIPRRTQGRFVRKSDRLVDIHNDRTSFDVAKSRVRSGRDDDSSRNTVAADSNIEQINACGNARSHRIAAVPHDVTPSRGPRAHCKIAHATARDIEQIRQYLEVDSLAYLSLEGMLSCAKEPPANYCTACFSGKYPIPIERPLDKHGFEKSPSRLKDVEGMAPLQTGRSK